MRPTLEEQIYISKLTREECIKLLMPHTPFQRLDYWIFRHCHWLHSLYWGIVNFFYPWDIETKRRYIKWLESPPNKG